MLRMNLLEWRARYVRNTLIKSARDIGFPFWLDDIRIVTIPGTEHSIGCQFGELVAGLRRQNARLQLNFMDHDVSTLTKDV